MTTQSVPKTELENGMITVIATLEAKEGKEEALEKALSQIIEPTRKEGGCINYDLHRTLDNPKVFRVL